MNSAYIWLIVAFILMVAEIIGTDFFLLFLGIAALVTAIVTLVADISFSIQSIIFGVLALVFVTIWLLRHLKKSNDKVKSYQPNAGLASLIGTESEVAEINSDGTFKIVLKDSVCLAEIADVQTLKVGDKVKITAINAVSGRPIVVKI